MKHGSRCPCCNRAAELERQNKLMREALVSARGVIVSLGATFYSIANGVYGADEIMEISPTHNSFCNRRCGEASKAVESLDLALKERDAEAQP